MLCWWAWILCVVILGSDHLVQEPAGSSAAVVVCVAEPAAPVVAAECAACDGLGGEAFVGVGPDVMAEAGTERRAGEEAVLSETRVEIVPGQPGGEKLVLVVVAAAAADGPAFGATAWTAGADGLAGTAVSITVLGSKVL